MHYYLPVHSQTVKILFDATKAESEGNADWVVDADLNNLRFSSGPPRRYFFVKSCISPLPDSK